MRERDGAWDCDTHGPVSPLWRPAEASYAAFGELLGAVRGFPTYLPWPVSPGWSVADFGAVVHDGRVSATMTCCSGPSELDGPVDLFLIAEEAGTGLGARCAGLPHSDPGGEIGDGPPPLRVRTGPQTVPLWPLSTSSADDRFERSVLVGEAAGRWLWLVLRPASAILLLRDEWMLRDAADLGPELVELPFGGTPPPW